MKVLLASFKQDVQHFTLKFSFPKAQKSTALTVLFAFLFIVTNLLLLHFDLCLAFDPSFLTLSSFFESPYENIRM